MRRNVPPSTTGTSVTGSTHQTQGRSGSSAELTTELTRRAATRGVPKRNATVPPIHAHLGRRALPATPAQSDTIAPIHPHVGRRPLPPTPEASAASSRPKKLLASIQKNVSKLRQSVASAVSRPRPPEHKPASADDVKRQYAAAMTEQLRDKTKEMCDWDLSDIGKRLRANDSSLWPQIRPRVTDLAGTKLINDMSLVPEADRDAIQSIRDFIREKDVQENFVQAGTTDWYKKTRTEAECVVVMAQMARAKNLILQFHGRPADPEPVSAAGSS
jgi:hypothetical protein